MCVCVCVCVSLDSGWLPGMKWVCCGSHDHHMTFTAVETLFTLLAHSRKPSSATAAAAAETVLCHNISTISRDTSFIEVYIIHKCILC